MKKHVKLIGQVLKGDVECSVGFSSTNVNQTAKRVLKILSTCSLLEMAEGGFHPSSQLFWFRRLFEPKAGSLGSMADV